MHAVRPCGPWLPWGRLLAFKMRAPPSLRSVCAHLARRQEGECTTLPCKCGKREKKERLRFVTHAGQEAECWACKKARPRPRPPRLLCRE